MTGGDHQARRVGGLHWQRSCAVWLKEHGWPLAASSNRGADMVAGPVAVEATITRWDQTWVKLGQAAFQAVAAEVPYGAVWRRRNREPGQRGATDPGLGAVVMQADRFWALVAAYEDAEARAAQAEADLQRWMSRERVS